MKKQKSNYKPLFFTLLLSVCAAATVIFFSNNEAKQTTPVIKLSYFIDNHDFVGVIESTLKNTIQSSKYFWIGIEPEKINQVDLARQIKQMLEKHIGLFDIVLIDQELTLGDEIETSLNETHEILLKENFDEAAQLFSQNNAKRILVIAPAIYASSLIKLSPQVKITDLTKLQPVVFSIGYFPAYHDDEKNNLFTCDTEDKTGTSPWGCAVLNKARTIRRQIDLKKLSQNPRPFLGLMDLVGDNEYMILLGK